MQKSGWTFTTLVGRYSDYSIKKRTSLGVRLVLFSVEIKGNKTLTYYLLPFQNNKKWSKQRCLIRTGNEQGLGLHNPALSETDRSRGQCVQCQHFVILSLVVVCVRQESRFLSGFSESSMTSALSFEWHVFLLIIAQLTDKFLKIPETSHLSGWGSSLPQTPQVFYCFYLCSSLFR